MQGILLLATEMDESDLSPFLELSIPIVLLDNGFPNLQLNTVSIDNFGGTGLATTHLLNHGHKRIGYMQSSVPIRNFDERYFSFVQTLAEAGLKPADVIKLEPNMEGAYKDMKQWLSVNNLSSTAFVGDNDFIVLGAIRALREENIKLGHDISVVGFDDLPFTRFSEPPQRPSGSLTMSWALSLLPDLRDYHQTEYPLHSYTSWNCSENKEEYPL